MTIWVHMRTAPLSANLRGVLRSKHRERATRNELSVTLSVDSTQAIVKIAGADRSFIDSLGLDPSDVIRVYTERDHREIFDDVGFYTPAWQTEDEGETRVRAARDIQPLMMAEENPSLWRRIKNWVGMG